MTHIVNTFDPDDPNSRTKEFHFGSFPLHSMLKVAHLEGMADLHTLGEHRKVMMKNPNSDAMITQAGMANTEYKGELTHKLKGQQVTPSGHESKN